VDLVTLMAGSLPRTPFRDQVVAAAGAGFKALTCWPNVWRHAQRKDGLTLAAMRTLLDDHGLVLTDVDSVSDWATSGGDVAGGRLPSGASRWEAFDVAAGLGATTVVAVHAVGAALLPDPDVEAFVRLCDDAAERGLRVALEFVPFTGVPDLVTALALLQHAGRSNAGLVVDVWHVARSGGTPDDLRAIPPDRVFTVQLADGPADAPADLIDEAAFHRALPGAGEMHVADCLAVLAELRVRAPVGPEVFSQAWQGRPPGAVAADLFAATTEVLQRATRPVTT
jgi:sugar phosphate isomerase/epimerase